MDALCIKAGISLLSTRFIFGTREIYVNTGLRFDILVPRVAVLFKGAG